jgi:hypothetical protein
MHRANIVRYDTTGTVRYLLAARQAPSYPLQLENPPNDGWEELACPNISTLKGKCGGEFTQAHKGDHDPILRKRDWKRLTFFMAANPLFQNSPDPEST